MDTIVWKPGSVLRSYVPLCFGEGAGMRWRDEKIIGLREAFFLTTLLKTAEGRGYCPASVIGKRE